MTDASEYFPPRLRGQVAVITGAARGLGRAYALRLARLGADIVVNDINLASAADVNETLTADTVMDEIRHLGRQALGIAADVTSEADVQRLFEEIFATFPQVNILINNAGGGRGGNSVTECSADAWDAVIDKNLRSTFLCCRAVAPHMRERRSGKIINVASVAGLRPLMPVLAPYAVAKAGIMQLTRALALELAPYGVNVNAIAPGYVTTVNWMGGSARSRTNSCPRSRWDVSAPRKTAPGSLNFSPPICRIFSPDRSSVSMAVWGISIPTTWGRRIARCSPAPA